MLATVAFAVASQVPEPYLQDWQTMLRKVTQVEKISLLVDVDPSRKPGVLSYDKASGMSGLERLAAATQRSVFSVESVYVLRRKPEVDDVRFHTPHQHVMAFLTSLGATDTMKLCDAKLDISSVPPTLQRRLKYALSMLGNGLGDSILANYPERIGMRLVYEPLATADSRTGDGPVTLNLTGQSPDVPYPDAQPAPVRQLGRLQDGEVDFQDGGVYTLSEIVERAQRTFGHPLLYDQRLAGSQVFISGTYTEERLRRALDAVLEPFPVTPNPQGFTPESFEAEKRQVINLAFGLMGNEKIGLSDLTYNNLITGKVTSFKEIYGTKPPRHVQRFMSDYRIQPDDSVTVTGELFLAFSAPGLATLPTEVRDALGNPVPYSVPHFIKVGF